MGTKRYIAEEWKDDIIDAISKTNSMTEAYKLLGLERKTFKRMAEELGVYKPNQSGKGINKKIFARVSTEDILNNKVPFQSHKLKIRLINEGYFERKCNKCERTLWLGKKIPLELHHKDGDNTNNELSNLELLCPNCHALTDTYRSKNIPLKNKK
jgi:hypothetical protein